MKLSLRVQKELCAECALALRRFIGGVEGVGSIEVRSGAIEIDFDSAKMAKETLMRISRDSVERLGYKVLDEG